MMQGQQTPLRHPGHTIMYAVSTQRARFMHPTNYESRIGPSEHPDEAQYGSIARAENIPPAKRKEPGSLGHKGFSGS
jgi:hypothetical protein